MYDDRDIMDVEDVVGIQCKGFGNFDYDVDTAFDVYSQRQINTRGISNYLINH